MTTLPIIDDSLITEVEKAIRLASKNHILPYFGKLDSSDIREKSPGDIVTIADIETEAALAEKFVELIPNSQIVGEEADSSGARLSQRLTTSETLWIIDPLDGTQNFTSGSSRFATLVTLVVDGQPACSWTYTPILKTMAIAIVGRGAYVNGKRVQVNPPVPRLGFIDIAAPQTHWWPDPFRELAENLRTAGANLSHFDTAGLSYLDVVLGQRCVLLLTWESVWDHAAGLLLLQEAGGTSTTFDGSAFALGGGNALPLIAAPSHACAQLVHNALLGAPPAD